MCLVTLYIQQKLLYTVNLQFFREINVPVIKFEKYSLRNWNNWLSNSWTNENFIKTRTLNLNLKQNFINLCAYQVSVIRAWKIKHEGHGTTHYYSTHELLYIQNLTQYFSHVQYVNASYSTHNNFRVWTFYRKEYDVLNFSTYDILHRWRVLLNTHDFLHGWRVLKKNFTTQIILHNVFCPYDFSTHDILHKWTGLGR